MVNVDEQLTIGHALANRAKAFETGRVRGDHTVELQAALWPLDDVASVEEVVFLWNAILVPAGHLLPFVLEGEGETEQRAHAITIRADVADDTDRLALSYAFDDAVNNLWVRLHWIKTNAGWLAPECAGSGACRGSCAYSSGSAGLAFSKSSMIPSTRLPRAIESSIRNRRVGVYFRTTARPTNPWMRLRWRASSEIPRFCWSALPRMLIKTTADCRSPATSTSLTVMSPASLTSNSRRMTSPISRFSNSRTRWSLREGIARARVTSLRCYVVEWAG